MIDQSIKPIKLIIYQINKFKKIKSTEPPLCFTIVFLKIYNLKLIKRGKWVRKKKVPFNKNWEGKLNAIQW